MLPDMNRCTECGLCKSAYQQIQTVGNCEPEECELLLVGDYPSSYDDVTGRPFSDSQYEFLWDILNSIGVKFQVTYITRCIAIDSYTKRYRSPTKSEYDTCLHKHFIPEVVDRCRPNCIVTFGDAAYMVLTGQDSVVSSKNTSYATPLKFGDFTTKIVASYEPVSVLKAENDAHYNRFTRSVVYACRHAMAHRVQGKYKSMTITPYQFKRLVDIWVADASIEYVGYDTETNGLSPWVLGSKITSFSVSVDGITGYNIFLYHPELSISHEDRVDIINSAQKLLTSKKIVVHHAKHEHRYAKVCWGFTPNIVEDTMYMSYIAFMGYPGISHGLKFLAGRFAGLPPWEETMDRYVELFKVIKRAKSIDANKIDSWRDDYEDLEFTDEEVYKWFDILKDSSYYIRQADSAETDVFMWLVPARIMSAYAGMDAIAPLVLMNILKPIVEKDQGLLDSYNMVVRAAEVFANIELAGIRLQDRSKWVSVYKSHIATALTTIRAYPEVKALEQSTGQVYNPASIKQTKELFFKLFRFPVKATTGKGEPSTSEVVLIELIKEFREKDDPESKRRADFLLIFREYKKLSKLLSTYFIGFSKFAHDNDGFDGHQCELIHPPAGVTEEYIHPGYTLHGTITGRLSSQDPSMHTIPYRSDVKKMVVSRNLGRGGLLVSADQSQLEIRVLACLVEKYYGDSSLAQAYRDGRDIHRYNASKIFKKEPEDIVDAERRFAKTISFSLLYGASESSVSSDTGRTIQECVQLFEQFYAAFPGVLSYIKATHQYVSRYGCVRTPIGRVKYLLEALHPEHKRAYADALRMAQNSIIQSTGSDLSLRSIIYMDDELRKKDMDSKIVAFVHDSITLDATADEWFESIDLLKYAMKDYNEMLDWVTCPLQIDVDISDNYGDHATIIDMVVMDDGSREFTLEGYDYVIDNIVRESSYGYELLSDQVEKEYEFLEDPGDLVARKAANLSYDGKTFLQQVRRIIWKPKK